MYIPGRCRHCSGLIPKGSQVSSRARRSRVLAYLPAKM